MPSNAYRIAIAGLGTVGAGVVKILQNQSDLITARAGKPIEIIAVNARSAGKDRGVDLTAYAWKDNPLDLIEDELILAIPPAPRHPEAECAVKLADYQREPETEAPKAAKVNPFAVLAELKRDNNETDG